MNADQTALSFYTERISILSTALKAIERKRSSIAWLRLLIVVATFVALYNLWPISVPVCIAVFVIAVMLFLFIVSVDEGVKEKLQHTQRLLSINNKEIQSLQHHFTGNDDGMRYQPANHAYANDLDLFGPSSLYQYINRCEAEQAKQLLADDLLTALPAEEVLQRQQAVKELSAKSEWRQAFQAFGMAAPLQLNTEINIKRWLQQNAVYTQPYWRFVPLIFSVITLSCVTLCLFNILTTATLLILIAGFYLLSLYISKKISPVYDMLSGVVPQLQSLQQQLKQLENESFSNNKMKALQLQLINGDKRSSKQIQQLKQILNRFDARLGAIFVVLNTFFLWDLQQQLALNKWKTANSNYVTGWLASITETEVISSLATFAFNNQQFSYPQLATEFFTLEGKAIGHPLIKPEQCVTNSFNLHGVGKIGLITGSNMGGKSTFLRSVGVNIVLALMGAPVYAESFILSPVQLMSSMRIADNLAESTSTFYAELKKLQTIIEAVKNKQQVFILLDEILRGTNSLDRHTGSKALIQQLIKNDAVAVIATHDVELAHTKTGADEAITNYHFDVQVANEELYFDYKLKPGVCQSLNATILMKKIGIDL